MRRVRPRRRLSCLRFPYAVSHPRTDKAALDPQTAAAIDADEDAGVRDLCRVVNDGAFIERSERGFDLAETLVDIIGKLIEGFGLIDAVPPYLGPVLVGPADLDSSRYSSIPGTALCRRLCHSVPKNARLAKRHCLCH